MRHHIQGRRLRLTRSGVMAGVTVLLTTIAVGIAGCSAPEASIPAPGAAPAAQAAPMAKSAPVRVQIPSIAVDSKLMKLGVRPDQSMEVPPDGFPAGWYTYGPTPGEVGPAIIAGHIDWAGSPGVFNHLRELKPGDEVAVAREDGTAAVFRVTRVEQFPKDRFPTDMVYGNLDHSGLRLITCGGAFDRQARSYDHNIIAFADLVETRTA